MHGVSLVNTAVQADVILGNNQHAGVVARYLNNNKLLPGFVDGYSHIHHDEQRHIGYGIWYLREAARDAALAERIRARHDSRLAGEEADG